MKVEWCKHFDGQPEEECLPEERFAALLNIQGFGTGLLKWHVENTMIPDKLKERADNTEKTEIRRRGRFT